MRLGDGGRRVRRGLRAGGALLGAAGLLAGSLIVDGHGTAERRAASLPADAREAARVDRVNLLATPAITSYLSTRTSQVTMALYDADTGKTYTYAPGRTEQTASVVKLSILATLLAQHQRSGAPLDAAAVGLATDMIEHSSDDAATELWDQIGGAVAVGAFDQAAGLTDTRLGTKGFWGETTTTALDQVRVVKSIVYPGPALDPASQSFALGLMNNLEADQRWGVSSGVPAGVTVALKDGWVPLTSYYNWQVNSAGWVDGDGRNYVLAVLTDNDGDEQYGIDTIAHLAPIVWSELAPPVHPAA